MYVHVDLDLHSPQNKLCHERQNNDKGNPSVIKTSSLIILQTLTEISLQIQTSDDLEQYIQVTECLHLLFNFNERLKDYEKISNHGQTTLLIFQPTEKQVSLVLSKRGSMHFYNALDL